MPLRNPTGHPMSTLISPEYMLSGCELDPLCHFHLSDNYVQKPTWNSGFTHIYMPDNLNFVGFSKFFSPFYLLFTDLTNKNLFLLVSSGRCILLPSIYNLQNTFQNYLLIVFQVFHPIPHHCTSVNYSDHNYCYIQSTR